MKTATVRELKKELGGRSHEELLELCLSLSKFKKENKELLTYLLYEAADEPAFIENVKAEISAEFELINRSSYYYMRKSVRKILRMAKKYIRYSKKKKTEVEILLFFCHELKDMRPSIIKNVALVNLFDRQIVLIRKSLQTLHEDLQYDYNRELEDLIG